MTARSRARILYLVAAEGNGHATRSAAVIERLKERGHEVIGVSEGNALSIIAPVCDRVIEAVTPHMEYRKNAVSALGTLLLNAINIPRFIQDLRKLRRFAKESPPDLIISDFNPMASLICKAPVVSIDNEGIITKGDIEVPAGWWIECMKSKIVVWLFSRGAAQRIITTFFDVPVRMGSTLVGPIVSRGILSLKPNEGRHILVYQTSRSNDELARILPELGIDVRAYGFSSVGKVKRVSFRPFDRENWFRDLSSCKAVIMNGGFSLMTEAMMLKKPILSFPISHQFEQALNAHYLEKSGLGVWGKSMSKADILRFIEMVPSIKRKARRFPDGAAQAAELVERFIEQYLRR